MTLKEYLSQKPIDEPFDLIPSNYISRDLHDYHNRNVIKIEDKNNRKIVYID